MQLVLEPPIDLIERLRFMFDLVSKAVKTRLVEPIDEEVSSFDTKGELNTGSCFQGRQLSPIRRRSGVEVSSTSATPRNSRTNLQRQCSQIYCFVDRVTVDRSLDQFQFIIVVIASETKFNQDPNLLKKTFCLAGDDLIFVHQHLLFLKTLRNPLGHFEKLIQTVVHAGILETPIAARSFPEFERHTSEALVVRPVKSLIQSLKHTSAIRLYSRRNSRN